MLTLLIWVQRGGGHSMKHSLLMILGGSLCSLLFASEPFRAGVEYTEISDQETAAPRIEAFFSFNCSNCYQFKAMHLDEKLKGLLPPDGEFFQFHFPDRPETGFPLMTAWAVSFLFGICDSVSEKLQRIFLERKPLPCKELPAIVGLPEDHYRLFSRSFGVRTMLASSIECARRRKVTAFPTHVINGRYRVEPEKIAGETLETYIQNYVLLVQFLLEKGALSSPDQGAEASLVAG